MDNERFGQFTTKTAETLALWTDINHTALGEMVDLAAGTAKDGVGLYADLGASAVEAVKEGQSYWLRRQSELGELLVNPMAWYQKTLLEGVEETQKALKRLEGTTQAVTHATERFQARAEQTAKEIRESGTTLGSKLTTLWTSDSN